MGSSITEDFFRCHFVGVSNESESIKEILRDLPPDAMHVADRVFERELRKKVRPVHGMRELLSALRVQSCVVSNSSLGYLHEILKLTQLSDFFGSRVFSGRDLGRPKPAPDLFWHAADELNIPRENCIVVEDSTTGVQAAKNAGMKVIAFMGGLHFNDVLKERLLKAEPDWFCSSTTELKRLLTSWTADAF
jgi:HAD superfamily hydrolase (TIGR01509 family)